MSTEIPAARRSFDAERAALQSFGTYIGVEEIDTGIFSGKRAVLCGCPGEYKNMIIFGTLASIKRELFL
jgi:hypothetical protein